MTNVTNDKLKRFGIAGHCVRLRRLSTILFHRNLLIVKELPVYVNDSLLKTYTGLHNTHEIRTVMLCRD